MKLERIKVLDTDLRKNGWWYPMPVLEKIYKKIYASQVNERFGELGFPKKHTIDLDKVAFTYENPQLEGDSLYVDINILDTEQGEKLKKLTSNVKFVVVGFGELDENKKMQESYEFVSIAAIPTMENVTTTPIKLNATSKLTSGEIEIESDNVINIVKKSV